MKGIEIIEFSPELQPHFKRINQRWVEELFAIEEFDLNQLDHPQEFIIDPGGAILFAKEGEAILGTVGLVRLEEGVYEMVKMGVSPEAQGRNIGSLLGLAVLEKARQLGGRKVMLNSNSKLKPALHLYRKLGFRELPLGCSHYVRCDVQMEIDL